MQLQVNFFVLPEDGAYEKKHGIKNQLSVLTVQQLSVNEPGIDKENDFKITPKKMTWG